VPKWPPRSFPKHPKPPPHDHRQSMWIMTNASGAWCWCYQCGAWRHASFGNRWNSPTGIGGRNPAIKKARP
jgi:hypothetical protein